MQSPSAVFNIGVDVAKAEIMVASAEGSFVTRKVANQRAALIGFLKLLPAASRIGIESTGSYHELLADLAHQRGFVVYVLNPKDILTEQAVSVRAHRDRCLAAIYPIKERDQALRVARQYLLFRIQRLTEFWCVRAIGRPASTSLGPDGDGWAAASTARTEQVNLAVMSAS